MKIILFSVFTLISISFVSCLILSLFIQSTYSMGHITFQPMQNGYNSSKVIILAFDDSPKSQFTLAKPVLDKYGFKGSFFTVCSYVNKGSEGLDKSRMTWQDINALQNEGHDIESHTMTHTNLNMKTQQELVYEIGGSKQCLLDHGINSTIFAYPASTGHENATVINVVAQYYDLARTGDAPMAFLHCDGYKIENNCTPFNNKGHLKYENRYDIMNWSDRPKPDNPGQLAIPLNNAQMLTQFIQEVNLQEKYNRNGCIIAIPIMVYHDFVKDNNMTYTPDKSFTDIGLFSDQMKYLHDNGFTVLKMSDLGYNQITNYLYIKSPTNALMRNC
jgi:peptidoglycan/xylan/chitin deacetylase (PgdA/CDA1 family)